MTPLSGAISLRAGSDRVKKARMFMISTTIFNDFELALQIPEVNEIKGIMLKSKARGAGMSGSGSAVFGVFTSSRRAKKCYDKLCESYKEVFLCKPVSDGCKVL